MGINSAFILGLNPNWSLYAQMCAITPSPLREEAVTECPRCVHTQLQAETRKPGLLSKAEEEVGEKWKRKTVGLLIINSTEFRSWEAGRKYIDVWKMLIKEGSTLWFGRHPSAQAVWNLTAAWANGASNAFGETRHETKRRALMSLADLSGSQDEWARWSRRC